MIKRALKPIAYVIVMALVMLGIVEMACRYAFRDDIALVRNPDHRQRASTAETNADGIRSRREASEFTKDDLNVIFLGDSFVFGLKESPELALPQQYERLARAQHPACRINVANFGWASSSPYLSLRLLKDIGKKYVPDVVFLGVDMTDFHDDLKYRLLVERPTLTYKALRYLPGVIVLVKKVFTGLGRFHWAQRAHEAMFGLPIDRFFIVNQPLRETERYGSAILGSVRDIAGYTENELHAKFVLLVFPRSFQYSARESPNNWERDAYKVLGPYSLEPFALFDKLRDSVKFPIYSLLHDFQTTTVFPTVLYDDPHWTEKGHRLVAERVYDISEEQHLLSCPDKAPPQGAARGRGP